MVLEKTIESPLDCKEIQPVHSKGDQSWVFFGSNDTEAETPISYYSKSNEGLKIVKILVDPVPEIYILR